MSYPFLLTKSAELLAKSNAMYQQLFGHQHSLVTYGLSSNFSIHSNCFLLRPFRFQIFRTVTSTTLTFQFKEFEVA